MGVFFEKGERAPPKLPLFVIAKFFYVIKSRFLAFLFCQTIGAHGGQMNAPAGYATRPGAGQAPQVVLNMTFAQI
jgi:hypothetical protein